MGWQLTICQRVRRILQKHLYFFLQNRNTATQKVNLSYLLRVKNLLKYLSFLLNILSEKEIITFLNPFRRVQNTSLENCRHALTL